jgi:hypothetical protein
MDKPAPSHASAPEVLQTVGIESGSTRRVPFFARA